MNQGGTEEFRISKPRQALGVKNPREFCTVNVQKGPDWDMPNNDIKSVSHAVLERVFFVKSPDGRGFKRAPKPSDPFIHESDSLKEAQAKGSAHVREQLQSFSSKMTTIASSEELVSPLSTKQFVDSYGGTKRAVYEAAAMSLEDRPLEIRDCRVKTFTKDEYRKPGGAPRAIQPRSARFNVQLGRYIKPLEHRVFETIDKIFDPSGTTKTVAKGMNMNTRGAVIAEMWGKYDNPIAVGLDASRFDQHINRDLLEFEHKIYKMWCTKGPGEGLKSLAWLLNQQRVNHGKYRGQEGTINYKVQGCRMSGDMNTSLGNVTIMCGLMYSYFEHKGLLGRISLLNDGDDCVIIMDRKSLEGFQLGLEDWFLRVGITMCYDGIYSSLEDVEFCQAHPVYDSEVGYRLVPRPTKRLYSDLVSTKKLGSKKVYRKWLGSVAGCGLATSSGLPIFQSFYSWVATGATPWIPKQGSTYYKFRQEILDGMEHKRRAPNMDERISFYFAFNITPTEQITMEKHYASLLDPVHSTPEFDLAKHLDPIQYLCPPEQKNRTK